MVKWYIQGMLKEGQTTLKATTWMDLEALCQTKKENHSWLYIFLNLQNHRDGGKFCGFQRLVIWERGGGR